MSRIQIQQLKRISVNEIVYDGVAIKQFGQLTIILKHMEDNTIGLLVNGQDTGWREAGRRPGPTSGTVPRAQRRRGDRGAHARTRIGDG
jgi:hypothetical protein